MLRLAMDALDDRRVRTGSGGARNRELGVSTGGCIERAEVGEGMPFPELEIAVRKEVGVLGLLGKGSADESIE
jgi:hypothetical protein